MDAFNKGYLSKPLSDCAYEFLENSKLNLYDYTEFGERIFRVNSDSALINEINNHSSELGYSKDFSLKLAIDSANNGVSSFYSLNNNRRSRRLFGRSEYLTLAELSNLLLISYFINDKQSKRFNIASAGGLNVSEIYYLNTNTHGILKGIYHYNPYKECLSLISEMDDEKIHEVLNKGFYVHDRDDIDFNNCSGIIIIGAVFNRVTVKYQDRGLRFAFLEAGSLMHSIYLTSSVLGIGCCSNGGFIDDYIGNIIASNNFTYAPVLTMVIGK